MGILGKIASSVAGVLNTIAPIAMFIPGLQWVSVASMVANVASGLSQSPPNWGGIIGNLVTCALPMGLGKALGAFKGGTAAEFAKLFSGKMSETLGEVASKVGNPTFSNLVSQVTSKLGGEAFQAKMAQLVTTATGTKAGAALTAEQIGQRLTPIAYGASDLLGHAVASAVNYPINAARSAYYENMVARVTKPAPDPLLNSNAPTMRVPPAYRG